MIHTFLIARLFPFLFLAERLMFSSYYVSFPFGSFWYLLVACCFLAWTFCFVLPHRRLHIDFTKRSAQSTARPVLLSGSGSPCVVCLWTLDVIASFRKTSNVKFGRTLEESELEWKSTPILARDLADLCCQVVKCHWCLHSDIYMFFFANLNPLAKDWSRLTGSLCLQAPPCWKQASFMVTP